MGQACYWPLPIISWRDRSVLQREDKSSSSETWGHIPATWPWASPSDPHYPSHLTCTVGMVNTVLYKLQDVASQSRSIVWLRSLLMGTVASLRIGTVFVIFGVWCCNQSKAGAQLYLWRSHWQDIPQCLSGQGVVSLPYTLMVKVRLILLFPEKKYQLYPHSQKAWRERRFFYHLVLWPL